METLKDLTAATARAIFEPWVNRIETRTGRRIKKLRVDGAGCYYKSFFQYLKQKGITKQTDMPHYQPTRETLKECIELSFLLPVQCCSLRNCQ
jgi:hypothetical protein